MASKILNPEVLKTYVNLASDSSHHLERDVRLNKKEWRSRLRWIGGVATDVRSKPNQQNGKEKRNRAG